MVVLEMLIYYGRKKIIVKMGVNIKIKVFIWKNREEDCVG